MNLFLKLFIIVSLFFMTGCTQKKEQTLKISINSWIGYAPFFYLHKTGQLQKLGFELIFNVSLAESADVYSVGKAQLVTTTQHEYDYLKKTTNDIYPVILIDRSNGGDMILSNKTIQELQTAESIDAYLETDSINAEMIKAFITKNNLNIDKINFFNKDQLKIQNIKNDPKRNIIIVTYTPYDASLKKKKFFEVASTKDIRSLLVIDALCAKKIVITKHYDKLVELKKSIDKAIEIINENPKHSYKYIQQYLGELTYDEFLSSLKMIKWINHPSKELLKEIKQLGYEEKTLIQ